MKQTAREALEAYYREAGSWAFDQTESLRKSRRIAWYVAGGAAAIALAEAAALALLMPLKTVEPYTLMVDRTTGFVQALTPLDPDQITPDRALVQSMLVQYVIGRESFDLGTLQSDYRKIGLWSADQARLDYANLMRPTNIDSPLVLYPRTSTVQTRVKSVSPIAEHSAMVRFDTTRRDAGGSVHPPQHWVAVIQYRFSGEPMSAEDRFLNPLGFQVTQYRRDPETLATAESATPSAAEALPAVDATPFTDMSVTAPPSSSEATP